MPLSGLLALLLFTAQDTVQTVHLTLVPSGMTGHLGGYASIGVPLSTKKPATLIRAPKVGKPLLYGTISLAGEHFMVALESGAGAGSLFVDSNGDGDLTNDGPDVWRPKSGSSNANGVARVRLPFHGKSVPCNILIVQSAAKMLTVIADYGYVGRLKLGNRDYPFFLVDTPARGFPGGKPDGATLGIDRKGNGVISGPSEQYAAERPFTIGGASLVLRSIDLASASATFYPGEKVAEIPLPADLTVNKMAPTFTTQTPDGKAVNFPADFGNRIVLVYAWATWSQPSMEWMPRVSKAYATYKDLGFSVLGLCLNRAGEGADVKAETAQMPWTTAFDGKSWSGDAVRALSINTLPFVMLVDGKSGKILATMDDLIGQKFETILRADVVGRN